MDKVERVKMVKAMEFLARHCNDEFIFETWLLMGVADGDIEPGDFSADEYGMEDVEFYFEDDESFRELMHTFLVTMENAYKKGGLYCDGVVSK